MLSCCSRLSPLTLSCMSTRAVLSPFWKRLKSSGCQLELFRRFQKGDKTALVDMQDSVSGDKRLQQDSIPAFRCRAADRRAILNMHAELAEIYIVLTVNTLSSDYHSAQERLVLAGNHRLLWIGRIFDQAAGRKCDSGAPGLGQ